MILTKYTSYDKLYYTPLENIANEIEECKKSTFKKFLYFYNPFNNLRRSIEFKILYASFRDTFELPCQFDYAEYLMNKRERES